MEGTYESVCRVVATLALSGIMVGLFGGCGSMYTYYSLGDAATITTNGVISAMDEDTVTREASVFYIEPGLRVVGLAHKSSDNASRVLILNVQPRGGYRMIYSPSAQDEPWRIKTRGKTSPPEYRWCNAALSCKTNEPFDQCVLRHCP